MTILLWVILALIVVVVAWLVLGYNSFVRLINQTKEAWADIDVQLKRRYDLIPNLIETVKGYATHEESVFAKVTEARANALSAQGPAEKGKAENMLTESLKSVFAVAEAYPALRAVESFTSLQTELADTENKIQAARRFYNGNVRDLNIKIETFPSNLIAKAFKFTKREFFQLEEGSVAKEPVAVKF
ncbi:MAG TPA: LemA family protein [Candidatus Paceibacterota bacterium]|nr:LemA family protein [Candidatus Paceibacterota bacterium]